MLYKVLLYGVNSYRHLRVALLSLSRMIQLGILNVSLDFILELTTSQHPCVIHCPQNQYFKLATQPSAEA